MSWPPADDIPDSDSDDEASLGGTPGAATSDSHELPAFRDVAAPPSALYVVEADPLYRRIFGRTLAAAGYQVRTYASPAEFLAGVGPDEAGCLIFAVGPAGLSGDRARLTPESSAADAAATRSHDDAAWDLSPAQLLARLLASRSPLAAVAVTAALPLEPALALLRRGAVDVLEKPVKRDDLVAAVREALAISATRRDHRAAVLRLTRLSERQFELLGLLASRWPRWALALRLRIRPRAIDDGASEILRILGVGSVADATEIYRDATAEAAARESRARARQRRRSR
jgi:FixJ family two-component response regulator